jgi:hypothetical protein
MKPSAHHGSLCDRRLIGLLTIAALSLLIPRSPLQAEDGTLPAATASVLKKYCTDCHSRASAEARIDVEELTAAADVGRGFKDWEKIIRMLAQRKMPPSDALQPSDAERQATVAAIRQSLDAFIARHAGDPGAIVLRRLTAAEYDYTIQDLTGLELKLDRSFVSDAVGGEGFTNAGAAQFMQDSTLERYLEAAKTVAEHAVIGAGPLAFFHDPGQTGRELSAIHRIQEIYREHGFRTAAGEGAEPFGLDLYPRAFFVAWQYRHRAALGLPDATIAQLAQRDGLSVRLCEHLWNVLTTERPPSFPLSLIVDQWHALPANRERAARTGCDELARILRDWQGVLAAAAGDEEEAAVLTEGDVDVDATHQFVAVINWDDGATEAAFELSVASACKYPAHEALVIWKNPRLRLRRPDNRRGDYVPLSSFLTKSSLDRLAIGRHPQGAAIGEHGFVLTGESAVALTMRIPEGMTAARLYVDVELDVKHGADRVVRCRISDGATAGETVASVGATAALLANPASPVVAEWQRDVAQFARLLPEVSHREPAPSDRDPIPPPFDNTYNMPERNHFHYAIKYHRDDRFLVDHILDDEARKQLDRAWTDLLTSFEYHDAWLRFVAQKFGVDPGADSVDKLTREAVARLPEEPRQYLERLREEEHAMQRALVAAEAGHLDDALRFADRAWRRPLAGDEQLRLRAFYMALRQREELTHAQALRGVLTRILIAPAFLYRAESMGSESEIMPLTSVELAGRLSYFLWSSLPDDELRRAADAGELSDSEQLAKQARRMLRDPKARRFATEFFGQWLGFYQFDEFRGIDAGRFPELTDALKSSMYEEAVAFFEHIVREDRPVDEMLFGDYTFLNEPLARHYGIDADVPASSHVRVEGVGDQHRGGLLGLAAVHAVTSAPLRTSAVKRGDWVLRRVIGTPVPPPPADVGSIPADDALPDGLTVRARLERHRTDASCVNCHSRIDPLGFALEHFDPIGRWRTTYRDGLPIDDSGVLSDGAEVDGLGGLRDYLRREESQFRRNLSAKLLGFALGRAELASDRTLIDEMLAAVKDDGRFSELVVRIVTSRQFRYRRS